MLLGTDQFGKETVDGEALATSRLPSSESLHKSNSLTLQLSLEKHNEADMSLGSKGAIGESLIFQSRAH